MAVKTIQGIVLHWQAHSWPLHFLPTPMASLHSVVCELGGLAGGPHTVVVLSPTLPPSCILLYLMTGRDLGSCCCTLVVIKLVNINYKSVYSRDWFTFQLNWLL